VIKPFQSLKFNMSRRLLLVLILCCCFDPGSCAEAHEIFFPYRDCVLAKIKGIEENSAEKNSAAIIDISIIKVLRGHLKSGRAMKLRCENTQEIRNSLRELLLSARIGHNCLLAFSPTPSIDGETRGTNDTIAIGKIYSPIKNQLITKTVVANLSKNIGGTVYPYRYCLIVKIKNKDVQGNELHVVADVEKTLLGTFSQKQNQSFAMPLSRALTAQIQLNQRFIWEFKDFGGTSARIYPYELTSLKATATNIAKLKIELATAKHRAQSQKREFEKFLKTQLTVSRIDKICRLDTRSIHSLQNLVPRSTTWRNQLFSSQECRKGAVTYYANLYDGIPEHLAVRVGKDWELTQIFPDLEVVSLRKRTEDDFVKARFIHLLKFAPFLYNAVQKEKHRPEISGEPWLTDENLNKAYLLKDESGRLRKFVVTPDSRHKLVMDLNLDGSVEGIIVDGVKRPEWKKAIDEMSINLDIYNSIHH